MNPKIKISNRCEANVTSIEISDMTKALMQCRAKLSDIYQTISDIIESRYDGDSYKSVFEGFENTHCALDNELVKITSIFIEVTSLESNYTEM